jgi:hypothetical protein
LVGANVPDGGVDRTIGRLTLLEGFCGYGESGLQGGLTNFGL